MVTKPLRQFFGAGIITVGLTVIMSITIGCNDQRGGDSVLRLAVGTTTRDSGLLDELVPAFSRELKCRVDVLAVGTGKALRLGRMGDAHVLLVHCRRDEEAFMAGGFGERREPVMYNCFELLGPVTDPALVAEMSVDDALQVIAARRQRFVSRGDRSGTHRREQQLWNLGGGRLQWDDYLKTGRGMASTLIMADQMNAYVLCDRGTYLRFMTKISLTPLAVQSDDLVNRYSLIVVNPANFESDDNALGHAFADFMTSTRAQSLIHNYRLHGKTLFYPSRLGPLAKK